MTKEYIGDGKGNLTGLKTVEIKWNNNNKIEEIKGSEKIWPSQMVLLALGFLETLISKEKLNYYSKIVFYTFLKKIKKQLKIK